MSSDSHACLFHLFFVFCFLLIFLIFQKPDDDQVKQIVTYHKRRDVNRILCAYLAVQVLAKGTSYEDLIETYPDPPILSGNSFFFII